MVPLVSGLVVILLLYEMSEVDLSSQFLCAEAGEFTIMLGCLCLYNMS